MMVSYPMYILLSTPISLREEATYFRFGFNVVSVTVTTPLEATRPWPWGLWKCLRYCMLPSHPNFKFCMNPGVRCCRQAMPGRYSSSLVNLLCHLLWSLLAVSQALLCTWSHKGKVSGSTLLRAAPTPLPPLQGPVMKKRMILHSQTTVPQTLTVEREQKSTVTQHTHINSKARQPRFAVAI